MGVREKPHTSDASVDGVFVIEKYAYYIYFYKPHTFIYLTIRSVGQLKFKFFVRKVKKPEMPLFLYSKEFLFFQHPPKFKKNTIDLSIT